MAHEIQHVEQRHSLRGMAQSLGLTAMLNLFLGDASALASLGGTLLNLKFSRDHESQADREGLNALIAANIDPAGMPAFFARMASENKPDLGFLSTHPTSAERMAAMDAVVKALPQAARSPRLSYDFEAIQKTVGSKPR